MTKYLKFGIFLALAVSFTSCKQDDIYYEGDPFLFFNKGEEGDAYVDQGGNYNDVTVDFGAMRPVDGDHQVSLVVDTKNSTAVEGTQYQILNNGNGSIAAGANAGKFTVRILEAGNTADAKKAVFTLKSSSIANAQFKQSYTLNMSLKCPISNFIGSFENTETWWGDSAGGIYDIVESTTTTNQLLVKDFFGSRDLVLNYNPDTFVITIPEQYTGVNYTVAPNQSQIWAKGSTDASQVSTFNTCTRKMTLYLNWYLGSFPSLGWGNQKEVFVGN
ncbi:hypothetical protein D1631_01785 [Chryseobacterium nematophagum]|uniref:DUF4843 domain-containing protein n=1 Tax=Chryseobacterium nematophagum TaxID=2305228 RepID=A0A3M7TBK6_9FLAO|nr:hypothetical protein [Chryseobacterium nematophagum]RNA60751.1 hypothetical protein D1631_01785 [Chryseobacterium nematophagum]